MKFYPLVLFVLLIIPEVSAEIWDDSNYSLRMQYSYSDMRTNPITDLINYSVMFPLDTQKLISIGNMLSDCSDIRVYQSGVLRPHAILNCNSGTTYITTRINLTAGSSASNLFIYYNGNSVSLEDWNTTRWDIFDNFSISGDFSKWTILSQAGTENLRPQVSDGKLRLPNINAGTNNQRNRVSTKYNFTTPMIVYVEMNTTGTGYVGLENNLVTLWANYSLDPTHSAPVKGIYFDHTGTSQGDLTRIIGEEGTLVGRQATTFNALTYNVFWLNASATEVTATRFYNLTKGNPYDSPIWDITKFPTGTQYYSVGSSFLQYNDSTAANWASSGISSGRNGSIDFCTRETNSGQDSSNLTIDDFRARQFIYPEPSITLISEPFVDFYNCSGQTGNVSLNFSIYNEQTPVALIPAQVEVIFELFPNSSLLNSSLIINRTYILNASSSYAFCIAPNTATTSANAYFKYTSGFVHRYYIINGTLTNTTTYVTAYNFPTTAGISTLKVTVRDTSTYQPMSGITGVLLRNYVGEGVWRVVQMDRTDDYGTLIFHVIEQDQDYKIILYDANGRTLKQTESMKFICTSGLCEITMVTSEYASSTTSPVPGTGITYNNSTEVVTVSWSDSSGATQTVRWIASKETIAGTVTICDDTTSSSAGSMTCDLTGYSGEVLVQVFVNGDAQYSEWIHVGQPGLSVQVGDDEGAVWTAGAVIIAIGFGLWSPVAALISVVFILVAFSFLGIFSPLTATTVITFALVSIVIGIVVKK